MNRILPHTLIILCSIFWMTLSYAKEVHSGFSEISGAYNNHDLIIKVWYPTEKVPTNVSLGYFDMIVSMNAKIKAGLHSLVIISHGDGSSDLNHRNLGLYLSKQGYMVAAVMHPYNNYKQNNYSRKAENWIHRPRHISKALDIIEQSKFQPYIDKTNISIIGYSAGAYTAVASIGGKVDISNIEKHCSKESKNDSEFCGNALLNYIRNIFQQSTSHEIFFEKDSRITSAVVLAPMGVQFYGEGMLDDINVPVLLLSAELDNVLPRNFHAEYLAKNIKGALYEVMSGAGHYSFITPFPKKLGGQVGDADKDPKSFDRQNFMGKLEKRILKFLRTHQ